MKKRILFISTILIWSISNAQDTKKTSKSYKYNNFFEASFSIGDNQYAPSMAWNHLHGIGKKKNFKIGYGVRWSSYIGSGFKDYQTAPAKFTSGQQGPQVLFSDYVNSNIDTVKVSSPYVGMANIYVQLQYTFFKKLDLGFNIDVFGFSYGSKENVSYSQNIDAASLITPPSNIEATPTTLNLLLISDNDIGGLNSEFYLRYWITNKWAVKGIFTFIFSEYTTNTALRLGNDRFRNKAVLFGLGVTYCPFK
jgi:hypothetical protein